MPRRTHVALIVVSLGLWLLVLPTLLLWRRQSRELAVVWSIASVVLVVLGGVLVTGHGPGSGGRPDEVVVVPDLGIAAPVTTSSTAHPTSAVAADHTTTTASTPSKHKKSHRSTRTTRASRTTRPATTTSRPSLTSAPRTAAPTTTPAASTPDPRFLTCIQAKAAGYGPYRRGVDPEYGWYWDFDGNGIVCE
jgi:hypothetical protein